MQIRSATDALGYATAALAAGSRGARALAVDQLGAAQTAIENLINLYVRSERTKGRPAEALWLSGADNARIDEARNACGKKSVIQRLKP